MMSEFSTLDDLLANQKKEKKELTAKTQKMKHGVPKGDKKKKKEVTAEITQLLSELDLKHEEEVLQFNSSSDICEMATDSSPESVDMDQQSTEKKETVEKSIQTDPPIVPRLTKAQKRRNRKAMIARKKLTAIHEQELENLNGLRHLEAEEIARKLAERHLAIHEVPSDGHCLYRAVKHQLATLEIKEISVQELRDLTSEYMVNHKEEFMPFMASPETGGAITEEQYLQYCEDIVTTVAWGGHLELQALSNVCGMPIEIIQADGPNVIAGDEDEEPKLIVCYHRYVLGLGEHYNSVVSLPEMSS